MIMLNEIHTVLATRDGEHLTSFKARLNENDTVGGMRERLVAALDGDEAAIGSAFDAAFEECEAIPGDKALGYSHCGDIAIEIHRIIGE